VIGCYYTDRISYLESNGDGSDDTLVDPGRLVVC
jgi:hypothetical protein